MERRTLTAEEARQVLGLGRNSVYEALQTGAIRSIRMGRRFLIPQAEIDRLLEVRPLPQATATQSQVTA